jgi:hypothetical protein
MKKNVNQGLTVFVELGKLAKEFPKAMEEGKC